jgi:structural maintenance of chromosome 2
MTLEKAISYVFGGTFVCNTADDAKKVCFDDGIRTRAVSLLGDLYEPGGTLSGGSAPKGGSILVNWTQLIDLRQRIASSEKELTDARNQLTKLTQLEEKGRDLISRRELLTHEVGLLASRLTQCQYSQLNDAASSLDGQLNDMREAEKIARQTLDDAVTRSREIERSITDFEGERKNKVKDIERQIASSKKAQAESAKALKKSQNALVSYPLTCTLILQR